MKKKLQIGDKVLLKSRTYKDCPVTGDIVAKVDDKFVVYCKVCADVYLLYDNELEKYVKPNWVFTDEEKIILNNVDTKYRYIARNKDNGLCLYTAEPSKDRERWWVNVNNYLVNMTFFSSLFKNIKWEDSEACEFRRYL